MQRRNCDYKGEHKEFETDTNILMLKLLQSIQNFAVQYNYLISKTENKISVFQVYH